jgi:signal transduction histidine kinase
MLMRTTSIRGKIAVGFLLSFLFLLLVAAAMFLTLVVVEDQVGVHAGVSRFLDTTLEMRRYEKNYLLYGQHQDLEAARTYAELALGLARAEAGARRPTWQRRVLGMPVETRPEGFDPVRTGRLLGEYRALLERVGERPAPADPGEALATVTATRDLGRRITDIAEQLSAAEGRSIQAMLQAGRRTLLVMVVGFLLGTALLARVMVLTALRPLQDLERGLQRIATGDYRELPERAGIAEIDSMNAAFNRMLHEVLEHRQAVRESERLASLGTALAGIAHEINNPLSNITTTAQRLQRKAGPDVPAPVLKGLDDIFGQTMRVKGLVADLLEFARGREPHPRPAELKALIATAVRHLGASRDVAGVRFQVECHPERIVVQVDQEQLERVFLNLLENAVDAVLGRGEVKVVASEDGARVLIRVSDSGGGMTPEVQEKVFQPFYSTKDRGTGLGLAIVLNIVQKHHGEIRVESVVGRGTTFTVVLPKGSPGSAPG